MTTLSGLPTAPLAPGLLLAGGGTVDNPAAQTLQTREPDAEA
jgi:hypothetical protein